MILLNRPEYKLECWITFFDFLSIAVSKYSAGEKTYNKLRSRWGADYISLAGISGYMAFSPTVWKVSSNDTDLTLANYLFDLLGKRYSEHYIFELPKDEADNLSSGLNYSENEKVQDFWTKLINIFTYTKDKYSKLLAIYEAQKDNLLNKVETIASGTTRFNDTPQDSGDYSDDTHTTNISQTSGASSTDVDTLMARIDEISKKFENVMLRWVNEFDSLFIEEGNIE